jgi:hypothetical protein
MISADYNEPCVSADVRQEAAHSLMAASAMKLNSDKFKMRSLQETRMEFGKIFGQHLLKH